ncbi:uncharacterized protein LOC133727810 [Rosa rugosa]|uniref:uncharacterized protein LOC133727810 n=1 Tax=Rosa rugosa TaxID=74645 RepID=UPI002B4161F9|nr:uncharacterized protein LOC133727810 [Rosa rugosa]
MVLKDHLRDHPMLRAVFHVQVKMFPVTALLGTLSYSQQLGIYEILRRRAISSNDGKPPSLLQEAGCGLIATAATEYFSYPLFIAWHNKRVKSMGPTADCWRIRDKWSDVLLGPSMRSRIGLGMGMLASYNPSLHYFMESKRFSEGDAKLGAGAISALSAVTCASLASSFDFVSEAVKSKRQLHPTGFFFHLCRGAPMIMVFWAVFEQLQKYSAVVVWK